MGATTRMTCGSCGECVACLTSALRGAKRGHDARESKKRLDAWGKRRAAHWDGVVAKIMTHEPKI